ncbi:glycosyltransferase family 4 protein [Stratiformator vulcanicus]|uniref:Glycosyl transferases group 1 n=1 Tax=Stratiformator vulcanicus TaxID=2527980 RepID=A0A517QXK7_9PLAN|nr:glycosyltransferase family 4 protein [Stratiformator vulcanicus]QDT36371.1 hypothetical protein Pan189_07270 [Stratiformator vulcanicus]
MKVHLFATYPMSLVIHGGQRRVKEILRSYTNSRIAASGTSIVFKPFWDQFLRRQNQSDPNISLIDISSIAMDQFMKTPLLEDVLIGKIASKSESTLRMVADDVNRHQPDAYQLEHPFLWPVVKVLIEKRMIPNLPVIYSGHNVEYQHKAECYHANFKKDDAERHLTAVYELETELLRESSLTLAVSDEDRSNYEQHAKAEVVLARNGATVPGVTEKVIKRCVEKYSLSGKPFALAVSSNHPPNIAGMKKILSDNCGYVPPGCRILLVGGCGRPIEESLQKPPFIGLNEKKVTALGFLPDHELDALRVLASLQLLMITGGGGTNVKTADALVSGSPIIATTTAMRGYEQYITNHNVTVCDDPKLFRDEIRCKLEEQRLRDRPTYNWKIMEDRRSLTWENTLVPAADAIRRLAA